MPKQSQQNTSASADHSNVRVKKIKTVDADAQTLSIAEAAYSDKSQWGRKLWRDRVTGGGRSVSPTRLNYHMELPTAKKFDDQDMCRWIAAAENIGTPVKVVDNGLESLMGVIYPMTMFDTHLCIYCYSLHVAFNLVRLDSSSTGAVPVVDLVYCGFLVTLSPSIGRVM